MARSFAQVFQSMDRADQLEELYVTSVKVIISSPSRISQQINLSNLVSS